jgi:hypothetical protein
MATPKDSAFLLLRDYRVAGESMQPANLKLPQDKKRQLQEQARRMRTDYTTWSRHLLIVAADHAQRLIDSQADGQALDAA